VTPYVIFQLGVGSLTGGRHLGEQRELGKCGRFIERV